MEMEEKEMEEEERERHHTTIITNCGARWYRGMFGALQPEGCGFESTSRGYIRCLAAGGLQARIHLKPPCRDPGQVLHSQLLMRFGVKLRFSVRAVVGSASE